MNAPVETAPEDSLLAGPDQVDNWRKVLLYDADAEAGVLDALPATPGMIGHQLGLVCVP